MKSNLVYFITRHDIQRHHVLWRMISTVKSFKFSSTRTFFPTSPPDSVLTAVTASTAISAKKSLSAPKILELIDVLAALMRFGLTSVPAWTVGITMPRLECERGSGPGAIIHFHPR